MQSYAVYINEAALASAPRSGSQRQLVMRFVRALADNPFTTGDFSEKDESGRTIQVKVVGRFAITFWANHADCEVKVTHIKLADK
ncbi:MAG: hypothetical protein EXS35_06890 [Pedosphaera sp.]|nr:hypothetical protein [Pedosphaera sp.]